jgi:DNA-binding response regulator
MGKAINVNAKEFEILKMFLKNRNIVLTRNQIIDSIWDEMDEIPYDRVIDVYVKELRKKLRT